MGGSILLVTWWGVTWVGGLAGRVSLSASTPFQVRISQGPLTSLGGSMCLLGLAVPFLRDPETRQPRRRDQACLAGLGALMLVTTHATALWAQHSSLADKRAWPSFLGRPHMPWHVLVRALLLPGPVWERYQVDFPIVPVAGLALLGAAAVPEVMRDRDGGWATLRWLGGMCLGLWAAGRFAGGAAVNLRGPTRGEGAGDLVCRFLCTSKRPASLAYNLLFLGTSGVAMAGFAACVPAWCRTAAEQEVRDAGKGRGARCLARAGDEALEALMDYGGAPLFFWAMQEAGMQALLHVPGLYKRPAYIVVPALSVPLLWAIRRACQSYTRFKRSRPPESLWRML